MKRKRKRIMRSVMLAMGIVFLASLAAQAGAPVPGVSKKFPDLTVSLTLRVKKYTNYKGVTCYSTTPVYTVTNRGQAAAENFRIKEEMAPQSGQGRLTWKLWGYSGPNSLGPGKSLTRDVGAVAENVWCGDKKGKVGYRVTVDDQNRVAESNEGNNTAQKIFPWFHIRLKP